MPDPAPRGAPRRPTPKSVRVQEQLARVFVTAGGLGTIAAIVAIFAFLVYIVAPLFIDGDVERLPAVELPPESSAPRIIASGVDQAQHMGWTLDASGRLQVRRLSDGVSLRDTRLFEDTVPTAWAFSPDGADAAFAFGDGTVRLGKIHFQNDFLKADEVSEEVRRLRVGGAARHEDGIVYVTPEEQFRFDHLVVAFNDPVALSEKGIVRLDYSVTPGGRALAFLDADNRLSISNIEESRNMFTDSIEQTVYQKPLVYEPLADRGPPDFVRLTGIGNTLYLIWRDGHAIRFDAREVVLTQGGKLEAVETLDLVPGDAEISSLRFMVGKTTLIVGTSRGEMLAYTATRPPGAFARDGIVTKACHVFDETGQAVTNLVPSRRTRTLAVAYADGTLRIYNVTNERLVAEAQTKSIQPIRSLALAPKEDGLVAFGEQGMERWKLDLGHPEASLSSLFTKVWYEGESAPVHAWQSEGGSDDFEPKFGLMPLVFGTLKAALYSILLAGPIALLAALFTSEFLSPRWRAPIKSVIEMMASLPSVVLGFLAAIVLAPFVDNVLMTVLCMAFTLPVAILLGARLWQFLPTPVAIRLAGVPRLIAITLTLPVALLMAMWLAPQVEAWWFGGSVKLWLRGQVGTAAGGWTFMLLPTGMLVAAVLLARTAGPWLRRASAQWSRLACAGADVARFVGVVGGGLFLAWLVSNVMSNPGFLGLGFDPRGSVVGPYEPRNAMIVGFVMGFAIVPIIYTLAEDALSSVPDQLREGSLGCGATQWQTAWRIVVPTAMSGLFSALMMGLGRAVGETMIVLMAAGNTPIMDANIFNGFRTLSANIATELPEAVVGSTHYRVLFLAALLLFSMTFVINGIAEVVRRHFRKRFADL